MRRSRGKTKSRNGSRLERVERTGGEYRRDPGRRNSRRKFGNLNIDLVKIFNKGCESIREYFKVIRIRRVKTEYSVLGNSG